MTIGWGKPINKLVNAVGIDTKIEQSEAPAADMLDPGLPESLQKLSPEAKASLQKVWGLCGAGFLVFYEELLVLTRVCVCVCFLLQ